MASMLCAALALLGSPLALAEAQKPATPAALAADDVCAGAAGDTGSRCALNALQRSRERAAPSSGQEAPTPNRSAEDEEAVRALLGMLQEENSVAAGALRAGTSTPDCVSWVPTHLPQWTFWSQEVVKRLHLAETGPDAPGEAFERFAKQAAVLSCNELFDPRRADKATLEYLRKVKATPGIDLPEPPRPWLQFGNCYCKQGGGNITTTIWHDDHYCFECMSCHAWMFGSFIELSWWADHLQGSKDYGEGLCWDEVKALPGGTEGWMSPLFLPFPLPPLPKPPYHFEHCLETPLTFSMLANFMCDVSGHVMVPLEAIPFVMKGHRVLPVFPHSVQPNVASATEAAAQPVVDMSEAVGRLSNTVQGLAQELSVQMGAAAQNLTAQTGAAANASKAAPEGAAEAAEATEE